MDELLTPKEAAALAKVGLSTLYRWKAEGKLETVPFGRVWRVRRSSLMAGFATGAPRDEGSSHVGSD